MVQPQKFCPLVLQDCETGSQRVCSEAESEKKSKATDQRYDSPYTQLFNQTGASCQTVRSGLRRCFAVGLHRLASGPENS